MLLNNYCCVIILIINDLQLNQAGSFFCCNPAFTAYRHLLKHDRIRFVYHISVASLKALLSFNALFPRFILVADLFLIKF